MTAETHVRATRYEVTALPLTPTHPRKAVRVAMRRQDGALTKEPNR